MLPKTTYFVTGEGGGRGGVASPGVLDIRSGVEAEADIGEEPSADPCPDPGPVPSGKLN